MEIHAACKHSVTRVGRDLSSGCECILAVDDEELVVKLEKEMLEQLGYKVVAMSSSTDALQEFYSQPNRFDLVIADMNMPGLTGAELAKVIFSVRKDVPVVLCTGFSRLIDEEKAKAIGIAAYLMKPFTYEELAKTVRRAMDRESE